jgi:outer membrane protein TolC
MKGPHQQSDGAIVPGTQRTLDAAVNLSWTLYDFGGRGGRIAAARSLLDAASLAANRTLQQTVAGVVQGYYGVVAADGNVQAAKTNESATARALEVARAKRGAGVVTLADVLQAETAYQQAVLARVQAEGTATSNRGGLAVAMGLPADRVLAVAAEPVPSEAPTLTARISDLLAEAARQRPDLAAARAARDAAQADVTVARSTGLPSITIGASHNYVNQQNVLPRENYNTVGVNVNVPLFSGFSVAYGVRQAKATLDEKEADVEQVRLQVSLDVWDGYHGLESANEQLKVSQALLKAALENQDVAIGRYEAGVATIVDVLTAQAAAATARVQRVSAEYNWELARAQLALALGRLTSAEPLSDAALQ